ncbi:MAG: ATP-binding protein [Methanolobus sp.]
MKIWSLIRNWQKGSFKAGNKFESVRVETSEDFSKQLIEFVPDIVISDYSLPVFDGMQALQLLLDFDDSIPFIVSTGSLNEETAVKCMKAGATDYVLKDRIKRLPFAVREAIDKKVALQAKDKAECSLRKSEERLKLAMEVSEHGFWDWNMDTNEAYFSPGLYSMLGYSPEEIPGTFDSWQSLVHPDDKEDVFSNLLPQLTSLKTFQMDFRMQKQSGEWIWVTGRGKPFDIDPSGVPHRAVGTFINITSRKIAEEQMLRARIAAEEANRYKNELLANISHELKTPLSSVIGFSDVLLEGLSGPLSPVQKDHVMTIHKNGNRLLDLINKMLDLSRIESGEMDLTFETFDPVYIVNVVLSRTNTLASKKNICIKTRFDQDAGSLTADTDKITAILYNLVENSLKFTHEGGSVQISTLKEEPHLMISVSDSGIGIKEEDLDRIFEPFVQVDGSTIRKQGGAGLGLMLVMEYTKMHNGEVYVSSEYGKGSIFTVKLPLSPAKYPAKIN